MDIKKAFGLRVKELRDERKLTQRAFAEFAGIDRSYLAKVENGEVNVGIKTQERIARGFGISVGEMMEGL